MRKRVRTGWKDDPRRPLAAGLAALWLALAPAAAPEAGEPAAPAPTGAPALDLTFDPQSVAPEETAANRPSQSADAPASAFDPAVPLDGPLDGPLLQRRGVEAGVQGGDRAGAYATLGPGPLKSTAELAAPRLDGSAGPDAPEARFGARLDHDFGGAQALQVDAGALWRLERPFSAGAPDAAPTAPLLDLRTGLSVTDGLSVEGGAQLPASGAAFGQSAAPGDESRLKSELMMRYNLGW
ncbi:MAG: hypothetical protein NXI21_07440 [Alphaproteobacteria bacterium]|nr:hypothetical protein [Alphaproteobacteria bacterium]